MRVAIIEDEIPARKKIKRLLDELNINITIVAEIDSVTDAIIFLESNSVDLIFSDIELIDGNAFEIYNKTPVTCPIIFTTAYNQFLMDAFECNGIAYLLKPFSKESFQRAWNKFKTIIKNSNDENQIINDLRSFLDKTIVKNNYKKHFMIHIHNNITFINIENISFFEASEGLIFVYDDFGKKNLLRESTLKEIEPHLDPSVFFRINRHDIINKMLIERIYRYNKNSLAIKLKGIKHYLITSQKNTASFKHWLEN